MVCTNNNHIDVCSGTVLSPVVRYGCALPDFRSALIKPVSVPHPHTAIAVAVRLRKQQFILDVSLSIDAPCVTAVWGRSGCGKTTLLRAIAGLEPIDHGSITVRDALWCDTKQQYVLPPHKRHVGFVFQEADLFPHLPVKRNLLYGLKRIRRRKQKFSWDLVVDLLDLHTLLERSPSTLSGGQKQRVAIGRALLSQPELLLLDEPVSALDSMARVRIMQLLQDIKDNCDLPMLYVTHQVDEVERLADRVCIMENGAIVDEGTKVDMLRKLSCKGFLHEVVTSGCR